MSNLATELFRDAAGTVVLVVQNQVAPTDDEWKQYVANVRAGLVEPNAVGLALTDGAAPNAVQRGHVNDVLAGRKPRSAVVSTSMALRGIVTALKWFNPETAAFSPKTILEALRFTHIEEGRLEGLWALVQDLDGRLSTSSRVVQEATMALRASRSIT